MFEKLTGKDKKKNRVNPGQILDIVGSFLGGLSQGAMQGQGASAARDAYKGGWSPNKGGGGGPGNYGQVSPGMGGGGPGGGGPGGAGGVGPGHSQLIQQMMQSPQMAPHMGNLAMGQQGMGTPMMPPGQGVGGGSAAQHLGMGPMQMPGQGMVPSQLAQQMMQPAMGPFTPNAPGQMGQMGTGLPTTPSTGQQMGPPGTLQSGQIDPMAAMLHGNIGFKPGALQGMPTSPNIIDRRGQQGGGGMGGGEMQPMFFRGGHTPRGVRMNNPFDISLTPSQAHSMHADIVGAPGQPGFARFPNMQSGYQAGMDRIGRFIQGGRDTISSMGQRYATDPNWASGVSRGSGMSPAQHIDWNNPEHRNAIARGILGQELGPGHARNIMNQIGGGSPAMNAQFGQGSSGPGGAAARPFSEGADGGGVGSDLAHETWQQLSMPAQVGVMSQFAHRILQQHPNISGPAFVMAMNHAAPWMRLDLDTRQQNLQLNYLKMQQKMEMDAMRAQLAQQREERLGENTDSQISHRNTTEQLQAARLQLQQLQQQHKQEMDQLKLSQQQLKMETQMNKAQANFALGKARLDEQTRHHQATEAQGQQRTDTGAAREKRLTEQGQQRAQRMQQEADTRAAKAKQTQHFKEYQQSVKEMQKELDAVRAMKGQGANQQEIEGWVQQYQQRLNELQQHAQEAGAPSAGPAPGAGHNAVAHRSEQKPQENVKEWNGKKYRLRPGADPTKQDSWEVLP